MCGCSYSFMDFLCTCLVFFGGHCSRPMKLQCAAGVSVSFVWREFLSSFVLAKCYDTFSDSIIFIYRERLLASTAYFLSLFAAKHCAGVRAPPCLFAIGNTRWLITTTINMTGFITPSNCVI